MVKVYHKLTIEAPASEVMKGLATIPGLQAWWMKQTTGTPDSVGGEIEFGDKQYFYNKMKVTKMEENKEVVWEVLESVGPTKDSDVWLGTTIQFELEEKQLERLNGKTCTILLFKHDGWPEGSDETKFFAEVNWHWAYFLLSLKYVSEGKEGMNM